MAEPLAVAVFDRAVRALTLVISRFPPGRPKMRLFDFLMILDSIIIGLGVAEILSGFGQLLRAKGTTRVYGVHGLVVVLIFMALLQHWWVAWGLREITQLTFPGLLLFVSGPVILFLLGYLAFPRTVADCDLENYYYTYARQLWSLFALYIMTAIVFRPIILGDGFLSRLNVVRAAGVVICLILAYTHRRIIHTIGVGVATGLLGLYMFWSQWVAVDLS